MMRTLRVSLILALALLIATPLLAQEEKKGRGGRGGRGGGAFGMMGGGMTVQRIKGILEKLTLSADEKKGVDEILDSKEAKDLDQATKDAALTTDQQAAMKEAITKAREDGLQGAEMMEAIQKAVKRTDKQVEAGKKAGPLAKGVLTKIRAALSDDNKAAWDKAARAGGRGTGKRGKAKTE
jgi:phosphopantetheinyl transferase (holo-ACP synthase)